jgi:hypothetical protein
MGRADACGTGSFHWSVWPRLIDAKDSTHCRCCYGALVSARTIYSIRNTNYYRGALSDHCWVARMSPQWIAVIGTSSLAFALKYIGHSVPESWLAHPRIQRINALIPIVLLNSACYRECSDD